MKVYRGNIPVKNDYKEFCSYEGCNLPVNSPHDENFCLGYCSIENKTIFDNYIFTTSEFIIPSQTL